MRLRSSRAVTPRAGSSPPGAKGSPAAIVPGGHGDPQPGQHRQFGQRLGDLPPVTVTGRLVQGVQDHPGRRLAGQVGETGDQLLDRGRGVYAGQVGQRGEEVADGSGAGMEGQPGPALPGLHAQGGAGQHRRLARPRLPGHHQRLAGRLTGGQPLLDPVEGDMAAAEQVPAAGGAALPARPLGEVAARLTWLGPGHQPGPGQLRPHPGDQRDRHEPVKPPPLRPLHQDPGQSVPGGVDNRPAAVARESADITDPVQLHRTGGGRACHRELPPHPVQPPLG